MKAKMQQRADGGEFEIPYLQLGLVYLQQSKIGLDLE